MRPHEAPLTDALRRAHADLGPILHAALDAVRPDRLVDNWLDAVPRSLVDERPANVIAVGKAAEGMLRAWTARQRVAQALLVVPTPISSPFDGVETVVASHPVPNERSVQAARRALDLARGTGPVDQLVVLLSGGTSSLLALPREPVTLTDKIAVTARLLCAGLAIHEVNTVRRQLSAVKGGRLASAAQGTVLTLAISDVVDAGDHEAASIGSGPTVPDPTTSAEAVAILQRAWPETGEWPIGVRRLLDAPAPRVVAALPVCRPTRAFHIIGRRHSAMAAAAAAAAARGYAVRVTDAPVVGEARDAGRRLARDVVDADVREPTCWIWSGETSVTVRGAGRGGRNQELALAALETVAQSRHALVLASVGTDGVDGMSTAAGAVVDPTSLDRSLGRGLDAASALEANDSASFFAALGDAIVTGPTGTNVCDLQVALVRW